MWPVIIVFAKAPEPGRVKTRLARVLGEERAAGLHSALVRDALESMGRFAGWADVELHVDIETGAWSEIPVPRALQAPGDLGRKMYEALRAGLEAGRPQAVIVGSDAPGVPPAHLESLLASTADVALGPARDGGYYAIACRRVHPRMFDGVEWSRPVTLEQTAEAARACGLQVEIGPEWFDVDSPEDLERLAALPELPRHVREWLRDWKSLGSSGMDGS